MVDQTPRFWQRLGQIPIFAWAGILLCLLAIFLMGKPRLPNDQLAKEERASKVFSQPIDSPPHPDVGLLAMDESHLLSVEVSGFSDLQGDCLVVVYDKAASFNKIDQAVYRNTAAVSSDIVRVEFDDVLIESIAIAAFQDKNKNGILDKNAFGIPTERYGFSNNPVSTFGPPSFQTASVLDWKRSSQSIKIQLKGLQ